jgi:uroporphyrinogen decarboxylase
MGKAMAMNKREKMLSWLEGSLEVGYTPAAFFMHFPPDYHVGRSAVDKHLDYFHYTDMDFVKIQYELPFPRRPEIRSPKDWAEMPLYEEDFFRDQLGVVKGLVDEIQGEALVIQTLYSPFMSAGHTTSDQTVTQHLKSEPEKVKEGLEIITESILWFVRECIKLGIDGFYASTQGGEAQRFQDPSVFSRYVKPYDLAVMEEINRACPFNILHVCDYVDDYADLSPFLDYPGDVVNCPLDLTSRTVTSQKIVRLFNRPYMGGLDRHGTIATGSQEEIKQRVRELLTDAPDRFVLGADCTLPSDTDWANIKTAVTTAHRAA